MPLSRSRATTIKVFCNCQRGGSDVAAPPRSMEPRRMLRSFTLVCLALLGLAGPVHAGTYPSGQARLDSPRLIDARNEGTRLAQSPDQRPRGRESVGTPRFEPRAGWIALGSKSIVHGSGDGRLTVAIGKRQLRGLHLVSDGNSVVIRAVRVAGREGKPISTSQQNLYAGASLDLDLAGRRGLTAVEIEYTARADGSRAPATLTVYGEAAPGRR